MMDEEKILSPVPADAADILPQKPRFRPVETLFAWLLLVFGYFFCRVNPMWDHLPFAAALLAVSIYAFTFLVLLRGRCRFGIVTRLVLLSAALALLAMLMWDNPFHAFLCFTYLIAAYAYLVCTVTGNSLEGAWSDLLGADLLRAWFVFPFSSFVRLFPALVPSKGKGVGRTLLKLLLGLALAVIPTCIAFALLSYDERFIALTEKLFRVEAEDPTANILRFLFGIPVAMYVFGLCHSSVVGRPNKEAEAERIRDRAEKRRVLPLMSACAAVIPLLALYVIYFVSQLDYFTSGFALQLPYELGYSDLTTGYADYAREGFFELCAVAALNFCVLLALSRYVRRGFEKLRRALCVVLALFTLVLIATAVSKLWLYVTRFGLTPDRYHAAWFMLLLTALFLITLVKQFRPQFKAVPLAMAVTVVLFLLLVLPGSNRLIARYNVDRFLSGRAQHLDVSYFSSLGDDAIPEMLRLRNAADRPDAQNRPNEDQCWGLDCRLTRRAGYKRGFWDAAISSRRAERLLAQAGYMKEESPP